MVFSGNLSGPSRETRQCRVSTLKIFLPTKMFLPKPGDAAVPRLYVKNISPHKNVSARNRETRQCRVSTLKMFLPQKCFCPKPGDAGIPRLYVKNVSPTKMFLPKPGDAGIPRLYIKNVSPHKMFLPKPGDAGIPRLYIKNVSPHKNVSAPNRETRAMPRLYVGIFPPQRQLLISGMSSPWDMMYFLCSANLS
jgi:hypothetical protein